MSDHHMIEALHQILAETYAITINTQHAHWNVTGTKFAELHSLFADQYEELAAATDDIAEHIRALDAPVPASLKVFASQSKLPEHDTRHDSQGLLHNLHTDHQHIIVTLNHAIKAAQKLGDEASNDLCIERLRAHKKHLWMIQASLKT